MNLLFERIQTPDHPCLSELLSLYLSAFPHEERRDTPALLSMLGETGMHFAAITSRGLAGLAIYWKFDRFLYLEHLAIMPERRREGIGQKTLEVLQKEGLPILLEVEIPYDETSARRTAFYKQAGFSPLSIPYFQPPYREGETVMAMQLFSDYPDWEPEELEQAIRLFHRKVYKHLD